MGLASSGRFLASLQKIGRWGWVQGIGRLIFVRYSVTIQPLLWNIGMPVNGGYGHV